MHSRIACASAAPIFRAIAAVVVVITAVALLACGVRAQTLADPNPPAKWSPPHAAAKSRQAAHEKSCSAYGPGFVNVPGTDTCIKVGGWVEMQGVTSGR
jgi:hypothetical protein